MHDMEIHVLLTGMGMHHARRATAVALADNVHACIVCGVCGALRKGYRRGEILAARSVRDRGTGGILHSDERLREAARLSGAREADLCTSESLAATVTAKQGIASLGDAVDMESFAVMEEAKLRGIPAIAIRAISDLANENLPFDAAPALDESGGIDYGHAVAAVLRSPSRLPDFLRLGRHSRFAAGKLAQFLESSLREFAGRAEDLSRNGEPAGVGV